MSGDNINKTDNEIADPIGASETGAKEKARLRAQLNADMEAFLAQGGKIAEVGSDVMADPPKKPSSNYGGQPI